MVACLGCGTGSDLPDLGYVEGGVSLDGKPTAGVIIKFQPEAGRPSYGETDGEGHYVLKYSGDTEGALLGEHLVTISTYPERVPEQFNRKSEMKREVVSGTNEFDFNLVTRNDSE